MYILFLIFNLLFSLFLFPVYKIPSREGWQPQADGVGRSYVPPSQAPPRERGDWEGILNPVFSLLIHSFSFQFVSDALALTF